MTTLTNEYLDDLIKKKLFKDFASWTKDDFHFLISLLNYPNYTDLALILLNNLKNWIRYSNGVFFYSLEKVQKVLDKYYIQNDIFEEINNEENIKISIKKKEDSFNNDFLKIDLNDGSLNFGDFLKIDTLKFLIYCIIFFVIFLFTTLCSYKLDSIQYKNNINDYRIPNKIFDFDIENLLNTYENDKNLNYNDNEKSNEVFDETIFDKFLNNVPKRNSFIKNILKKVTNYFL